MKRVEKVEDSLSRLDDLEDSQMETTLLQACLALPKVAVFLRSCSPIYIRQATSLLDEAMREALADVVGSLLSEWAWLKASLPSSFEGLNIRRASLYTPAAYIGSLE